jgi:parvulin-like peptidyl-prolyl isomerase
MTPASRRPILPLALLALTVGCAAKEKVEPLAPHFAVNIPVGSGGQKPMTADPLSGADQGGALYSDDLRESSQIGRPGAAAAAAGASSGVQGLSRTVQENVTAPGDVEFEDLLSAGAATRPTTQATVRATTGPTTAPTTAGTTGQYLTVGGVVALVNGVPIYANKVIALVEPVLSARAKELTPEQFRGVATKEITLQMVALRNLELEYAAAEQNLGEKDKKLAQFLTEHWRQRQISAAGGSEQLARRLAAERGEDFDELVHQQYRLKMSQVYYEKEIVPQIQVTASEIRDYYDRHRDKEFTHPGAARFRLIKIDVKKAGGREPALDKITGLRNRIVKAGQPFEEIARSVNDDPRWLRSGGDLGASIEYGAFAIEPVERAVWATPDGQVTDVIETPTAMYIAKVESKTKGSVDPFESEQVQAKIVETLKARDFRAMRQKEQERLFKESVFTTSAQMMNTAIEMAMQNYPRWSR